MTLEIITQDRLLPYRHGFFTRRGGASSGIFAGLNCGRGSSDQADAVAINRHRAAAAMGVSDDGLVGAHQIHSADVATITGPTDDGQKVDGLVTATPGLALSILTADCQPVLFADERAGVIGAAHAGWKGAIGGIFEAMVDAMEALGATRRDISAVIGPSISQDAYEVGPEFRDRFIEADPLTIRYFRPGKPDKFHFDLPAYGLSRLEHAGITRALWTGHCTYRDPDRFFSYRRSVHQSDPDYGRLISAIRI